MAASYMPPLQESVAASYMPPLQESVVAASYMPPLIYPGHYSCQVPWPLVAGISRVSAPGISASVIRSMDVIRCMTA